LKTEDGTS